MGANIIGTQIIAYYFEGGGGGGGGEGLSKMCWGNSSYQRLQHVQRQLDMV